MSAIDFFKHFFIDPIISKTGYNPINTLVYAFFSLSGLWLVRHLFFKYKIEFNTNFIMVLFFTILFGSSMRVITDSYDSGTLKAIFQAHPIPFLKSFFLDTGFFQYSIFTVSPFIYITVSLIFLFNIFFIFRSNQKLSVFLSLFLAMLFSFPLFLGFKVSIFFPILILIPILILFLFLPIFSLFKINKNPLYFLLIFGQAIDGFATFFALDIINNSNLCYQLGTCYSEQHVFSGFLGGVFNTFLLFFIVKLVLSFLIVYVIDRDKDFSDKDKTLLLLAVFTIGLAPGFRDIMRMCLLT